MHEFSIAQAIIEQVSHHAPQGAVVRKVTIEAGPMRGIVPEAMRWAWQAATNGTAMAGSQIDIVSLPWTLRCPSCGMVFDAVEMFESCKCGCERTMPEKSDVLRLMSIDVDDIAQPPVPIERKPDHAGSHS